MSSSSTLYEGDGRIHAMPLHGVGADGPQSLTDSTPYTLAAADPGGVELQAWTRRIDAIGEILRSASEWLDYHAARAHQRRMERLLSQITSGADLERRLRELERGARLAA